MLLWLKAMGMCQSMFCAIPCVWHGWEEKARDKMLFCLPFIGLEIGVIWWGIGIVCRLLPTLAGGALLAFFPWVATGFIHLDGFMDVTDAVKSCRNLEKRRVILKDSHVGAFAVIGCVILAVTQFACCTSLGRNMPLGILVLIPAVSRCGSVMAVNGLPAMQTSQYAGQTASRSRLLFPGVLLMLFLVLGIRLFGIWAIALGAEIFAYALSLYRGYRSLDGMNGDISGYCITVSEAAACAALCVLGRILCI